MLTVEKELKGHPFTVTFEIRRVDDTACIFYSYDFAPAKHLRADGFILDQHAVRFIGPDTLFGVKVNGLSLPPALFAQLRHERDAMNLSIREENAAHKAAILDGTEAIHATFQDGEYLSGYTVSDRDATQALVHLGVAREVSGWGTHIEQRVIDALGTTFTIPQVEAFTAPEREAQAQAQVVRESNRQAKIAEAQATGQRILLHRWTTSCNDTEYECSIDLIEEYAYPDGSVRMNRIHTY